MCVCGGGGGGSHKQNFQLTQCGATWDYQAKVCRLKSTILPSAPSLSAVVGFVGA
jgi:hypothetical protein